MSCRGFNVFLDMSLYAEVDTAMLINGVNTMIKVVTKLLLFKGPTDDRHKRMKYGDCQDDEAQDF